MIVNKIFRSFLVIVILLIGKGQTLKAQQTPTFSEYNYNPFLINPAYAGMLSTSEASISNSGFFNQIDGSPKSISFSFNSPLNRGKVGLGAGLVHDQIGVTSSTQVFGAYSYKIFFDSNNRQPYWKINEPEVLSFGITAGVHSYQENLLELGILDDPNFAQNVSATIPTIGLGVLFNYATFYVGFSAPNVLGDKLASTNDLNLVNPYYGYFGYRIYTSIFEELMIKPNVLLKHEKGAPVQADINIALSFKDRFEVGTGYRTSSSINFLAGVYFIKNLRLIYNYSLGAKNNPIMNTHGLMLSYRFGEGYYNAR